MTTRRRNSTSRIERGDFQTPPALAEAVCRRLAADGIAPRAVLEPGCGTGAFVRAALDAFPTLQAVLALDVSGEHLAQARHAIRDARVTWAEADLFRTDLRAAVASLPDPLLVLGNPPWVTTAEIGRLAGSNRPARDGRRGVPGVGAITGSSNFDVSEWIARACLDALAGRDGVLALLVKTPVARRLVTAGAGAGSARMARIDAARAFGVQVGAALLVMRDGDPRGGCPVYDSLEDGAPCQTLALRGGRLVADLARWTPHAHLEADAPGVAWRSGVKHDCAPVLELRGAPGAWRNGLGEDVDVETECVYPLRKGADVGHERPTDRWVLIPQRSTGEDPARLREAAPRTWRYLCRHAERLDGRRSRIYRGRPRFAIFGVGAYSFTPWKVAVAALYPHLRFEVLGPLRGRPVLLDDTVYLRPCDSEAQAHLLADVMGSAPAQALLGSRIFADQKRPVTAALLNGLDPQRMAVHLGLAAAWADAFGG